MTPRVVRHWIARLGFVGGMGLVLAGCPEDAADITEFASDPGWNFPVAGAYVEPGGSFNLDNLVFLGFDLTLSDDAFGRGGEPLGFNFVPGAYVLDPAARNVTDDPRLPALGGSGTEVVGDDRCRFGDGGFWGGSNGWDFYCFLEGLQPSTDYTVMLVRYALTVNGDLDTEDMLLNGSIADPDALAPLGGAPGGYPEELCDFDRGRPTFTTGVTGDQNPFVMGYTTTGATGALVFDCLVGSGGFWSPGSLEDAALAPFAPNDPTSFDLPRYNYVVIVEGKGTAGSPVPAGPEVMRFQVGVDIDANGAPLPNGMAPLPTVAATIDELMFAPGGAGKPDSLDVTYSNLEALVGGAVYEPWLVNPITGSAVPARGTYNRVKIVPEFDPITGAIISTRDSIVETTSDVGSFVGGNEEYGFRHQLVISDGTMPGGASDSVGLHTHLVLAITGSPGGTSLPDARPFFFEYTDQNGTADNYFDDTFNTYGVTTFGNFDATDPTLSRPYSGEGQGTGGFREDELVVEMVRLSRPPVGYQLVGWLIDKDATAYRLPDVTGPPPERLSLVNADVEDVPELTTRNGILEANFRALESTLGVAWSDMRIFLLTLEPKAGSTGIGPILVQVGAVPEPIIEQGGG